MAQSPDRSEAAATRAREDGDRSPSWVAPHLTVLGALDSHTRLQTQFASDTNGSGTIAGTSGTIS